MNELPKIPLVPFVLAITTRSQFHNEERLPLFVRCSEVQPHYCATGRPPFLLTAPTKKKDPPGKKKRKSRTCAQNKEPYKMKRIPPMCKVECITLYG